MAAITGPMADVSPFGTGILAGSIAKLVEGDLSPVASFEEVQGQIDAAQAATGVDHVVGYVGATHRCADGKSRLGDELVLTAFGFRVAKVDPEALRQRVEGVGAKAVSEPAATASFVPQFPDNDGAVGLFSGVVGTPVRLDFDVFEGSFQSLAELIGGYAQEHKIGPYYGVSIQSPHATLSGRAVPRDLDGVANPLGLKPLQHRVSLQVERRFEDVAVSLSGTCATHAPRFLRQHHGGFLHLHGVAKERPAAEPFALFHLIPEDLKLSAATVALTPASYVMVKPSAEAEWVKILTVPKLNTERIKATFGSFAIDTTELPADADHPKGVRVTHLCSKGEDGVKITRTFAVVLRSAEDYSESLAQADAVVRGSDTERPKPLGKTVRQHGHDIEKVTVHVGSIPAPASDTVLHTRMGFADCEGENVPEMLAVHVYDLFVSKTKAEGDAQEAHEPEAEPAARQFYVRIIELHHQDYLKQEDVEAIFGRFDRPADVAEAIALLQANM